MTEKKQKKNNNKEQLAEITELLQRTQANFENYRKQTEKRVEEIRQLAGRDMILQILPIMDNFSLALKSSGNQEDFKQGVELIYGQLTNLLENNNLKKIETEKEMFNPYFHEALMKVNSDLEENRIVEELQSGFTLNGNVIRHAKVKISNGKKEE